MMLRLEVFFIKDVNFFVFSFFYMSSVDFLMMGLFLIFYVMIFVVNVYLLLCFFCELFFLLFGVMRLINLSGWLIGKLVYVLIFEVLKLVFICLVEVFCFGDFVIFFDDVCCLFLVVVLIFFGMVIFFYLVVFFKLLWDEFILELLCWWCVIVYCWKMVCMVNL